MVAYSSLRRPTSLVKHLHREKRREGIQGGGGWQGWSPPPWTCPDTENLWKVCVTGTDHPPLECGWRHTGNVQEWGCFSIFRRADDVTRTMSKGGGCLWMSKSGGVFQFSGGRMTSRGQCPRGGGCLWMSLPPPPFRKSCIRACNVFLLCTYILICPSYRSTGGDVRCGPCQSYICHLYNYFEIPIHAQLWNVSLLW